MGSTRLFQLRKLKGFPHNLGDNFGRVDSAIPLSYRLEHADHVNALVALVVKAIQAALSRNGDEGSLVEVRIGNPCQKVRRSRAECREADAGLSGQPAPNVGNKSRSLFMAARHETNRRICQCKQKILSFFTRHTEDVADAFFFQTFHK